MKINYKYLAIGICSIVFSILIVIYSREYPYLGLKFDGGYSDITIANPDRIDDIKYATKCFVAILIFIFGLASLIKSFKKMH